MHEQIKNWTLEYPGYGGSAVTVPHAWMQDVPVSWEGPAVYRCNLEVPNQPAWILFEGVSYRALVRLNGEITAEHLGIWTAFKVPLAHLAGQTVDVEVEVTKNGGPTFPVPGVASGFLPFVFHTFGGIYREVYLVTGKEPELTLEPAAPRAEVKGSKILLDGKPFYTRGVLTWGWYPEVGHPNPPEEIIRREVRTAKQLGFNLLKFCLWIPSHRYLEILEEEGLQAWIELPIWDPSPELKDQEQIFREVEEIVLQYRHHANILFWTAGCELNTKAAPEFRRKLYELIKQETGSPLVKDNSGGAEMYDADPVEFGDFYDFHPYCETNFYPPVLDSLLPGPRPEMPILLGEFNDCDLYREVRLLDEKQPYWASSNEDLNAQGVRWQYDLPAVLAKPALPSEREKALGESSRTKALFIRKFVQEQVRARESISGYVITGWRDTPVSSSGFLDDWDSPRFEPKDIAPWNTGACLFPIPQRRPPWIAGGNRPGWAALFSQYCGRFYLRVGLQSEHVQAGRLDWQLLDSRGTKFAEGNGDRQTVEALASKQVAEISTDIDQPGNYELRVQFNDCENGWPIKIYPSIDFKGFERWGKHDPAHLLDDLKLEGKEHLICTSLPQELSQPRNLILLMREEGTLPAPFWREIAYEFADDEFWSRLELRGRWDQFLSITPDRVLDPVWLEQISKLGAVDVLLNRVDARTYRENPILVRVKTAESVVYATTLRPFGGLGISPAGVTHNPVGAWFLVQLISSLSP